MVTRVFKLFGVIFLTIGIVMVAIAGVIVVRQQQFEASSITAPGTVVEMMETGSNCANDGQSCSSLYAPRVSFIADNGSPFTFVSTHSSSSPEHLVGDAVLVRYEVTDLTTARIDSVGDFATVVVVGGIGVFALGFGVFWLALVRRSHLRQDLPESPGKPTDDPRAQTEDRARDA